MATETARGRETEPRLNSFSVELRGWTQENIHDLNLTELRRYTILAYEVNSIVSSFPTESFPELTSTKLIFPSDQQPTIIHKSCVAYKYHPYGGTNYIKIREGKEVEGKERQIELSFNGHTTGFNEVAVTTTRPNLREGLKQLISIGREAGGQGELESHGVNHPTTPYYPDFLPQQNPY